MISSMIIRVFMFKRQSMTKFLVSERVVRTRWRVNYAFWGKLLKTKAQVNVKSAENQNWAFLMKFPTFFKCQLVNCIRDYRKYLSSKVRFLLEEGIYHRVAVILNSSRERKSMLQRFCFRETQRFRFSLLMDTINASLFIITSWKDISFRN